MLVESIKFKGHRCFKNDWAGFDTVKPINVIIGRNNTGKSHLLDLTAALCEGKLKERGWRYRFRGVLDEGSLKTVFTTSKSGGALGGSFWEHHGIHFVGANVEWESDDKLNPSTPSFLNGFDHKSPFSEASTAARIVYIQQVLQHVSHKLLGSSFRRLLADRDIHPEKPDNNLALGPDGRGATNIIRRFIITSNPKYPREIIQRDLLMGLNTIFGKDGQFHEIQVKLHDEPAAGQSEGHWEVFLGEERKGLIPLSNSGSGLKTIILVLLNLLIVPEIEKKAKKKFTFAFEELENNLHPALLRRLFQFLENYAIREQATIFLTTH